jgi:hypothetical protein
LILFKKLLSPPPTNSFFIFDLFDEYKLLVIKLPVKEISSPVIVTLKEALFRLFKIFIILFFSKI